MILNLRFIKLVSIFLVLFFVGHLFLSDVFATSISIDKPVIKVIAPAGSTGGDVLTIKNKSMGAIIVKVDVYDWLYNENRELLLGAPGSTPYSCASWIDVNPAEIMIPPQENREVSLTVRVPEDAVGGHYATLAIESTPATERDAKKGMGVRIVTRIIALFLQETEGKCNKAGSIVEFDVTEPEKNKPLIAKYGFKNHGNTYLSVQGLINIVDKNGNSYGIAQAKKIYGTFPGDVVSDNIEWFGSLPKGEYDVFLTIEIGKDIFPIVEQRSIVIEKDID